jgi:hypothetical protein
MIQGAAKLLVAEEDNAMSDQSINPRELREIAEDIYDKIAAEAGFPDSERADLVTSIVRQWVTCDGHATLLADERRQVFLVVKKTPLGTKDVAVEWRRADWSGFIADWKIDPDEMPAIVHQLNRGQGAETITGDGRPLRVYVDPEKGTHGVEALDEDKRPRPPQRNYHKLATDMVSKHLGHRVAARLKEDLVLSVVRQWRRFNGHACVFISECRQLTLVLTEQSDGGTHINATQGPSNVGNYLVSLGFQPRDLPDVLERINLGQKVKFVDRKGVPSTLTHDPQYMRFDVESVGGASPASRPRGPAMPPVFCHRCGAVLALWKADQSSQTCPICGEVVLGRGS